MRPSLAAVPVVLTAVSALAVASSGHSSPHWSLASQSLTRPGGSAASLAPAVLRGLHHVPPAPAKAELSIGLLPTGNQYPYTYLGHDAAKVWYGPPGGSRTRPESVTDVVLSVRRFTGDAKSYRLLVEGRPARYVESAGYTSMQVRWSKQVVVGFRVPPNSTVSRREALRMAGTLDVRSTKHRVYG